MGYWEYKTVEIFGEPTPNEIDKVLNLWSRYGYELVSFTHTVSQGYSKTFIIMRRLDQ